MRVISGKYKGRNIISPSHGVVRPTTDLVKGSVFSILASKAGVDGARCLDLFCGTGGMGIEALSRGAASCVFVDRDTTNAKVNLDRIGISARTVCMEFRRALRLLRGERYDIIFCDPPYGKGFAEEAAELVLRYGMLDKGGIMAVEHSSNDLINFPQDCIIDSRVFGVTAVDFVMRGDDESDNSDICGNV